jgi:hypothetical protein
MVRPVPRAAYLLLAAAVTAAWPAPAAEAKDANPIVQLAKKLAQPVDFPGIEADPKMTLQEALDKLAANRGVTFDVNEAAFKAEMVEDVLAKPVAERPIPKMTHVSLDTVLRKILARIPAVSGATYVIRRDGIEITTGADKTARFYHHLFEDQDPLLGEQDGPPMAEAGGLLPPLVQAEFDNRPLEDALKELADATDWCVVLDEGALDKARSVTVTAALINVPLNTAVSLLANMAGLSVLSRDRALYVTTREKAAALRKELRPRVPRPNGLGGVAAGAGVGQPANAPGGIGLGSGQPANAQANLAKTQAEVATLQAEVAKLQAELARLQPKKDEPKREK